MEFLASLAIKALIGTSICGAVTVGTIYKCDRTLLGFESLTTNTNTGTSGKGTLAGGGDSSKEVNKEGVKTDNTEGKTGSLKMPETPQSPEIEVIPDEAAVIDNTPVVEGSVLSQPEIHVAGQGENSNEESSDSDATEEGGGKTVDDTDSGVDSLSEGTGQAKSSDKK